MPVSEGFEMTDTVIKEGPAVEERTTTANWHRITRIAASTIGIWPVVLQFMAGEVIPPVMIIGAVFVGFVPFLRGNRRKLGLVVAVLALIALLGNLPGTVDELSHPTSAPAFILSALVTVSALVSIVAGMAAFR